MYGLSSGLGRALGMIMLPIYSAYLSPEEFGVSGFLISIGALLIPVFSFGISASLGVCYFGKDTDEARDQVFSASFSILSLVAICIIPVGYFFSEHISNVLFQTLEYEIEVFVAFLGFAFSLVAQTWLLRSHFLDRAIGYFFSNITSVVVGLSLSWFLIAKYNLGALGIVAGNSISQIVLFLCLAYANRDCRLRFENYFLTVNGLLIQGIPLLPGFCFLYVIQNAVRWPVQRVGSLEDLGVLNIGLSVGGGIGIITSAVATAWLPYGMRFKENWDAEKYTVQTSFKLYYAFGCLLVSLIALFSYHVILVLTNVNYLPSAMIVGLAACFTFLLSVYSLLQLPLYLADKVTYNSIPQGFAALFTIFSFAFVLVDVLIGAAISLVFGAGCLIFFQQILVRKLAVKYSIPFDKFQYFRMTFMMLILVFMTSFESQYYFVDSVFFVLFASIFIIIYYMLEAGFKFSSIKEVLIGIRSVE